MKRRLCSLMLTAAMVMASGSSGLPLAAAPVRAEAAETEEAADAPVTDGANIRYFDTTLFNYKDIYDVGSGKDINALANQKFHNDSKSITFHADKRGGRIGKTEGVQNQWTHDASVVTGMAKDELNGSKIEFNYNDQGLFTLDQNTAKDVFTNVQFPMVLDDDGYYTFDSRSMVANFRDGIGKSGAKMDFYYRNKSNPGAIVNAQDGFYPFNAVDPNLIGKVTNSNVNDKYGNTWWKGEKDWWFGMNLNIDFYMMDGGFMTTKDGRKEPIIFDFYGDDDVWVYIDGKLVMDLGGIHDTAHGTIDFGNDQVNVTPGTKTAKTVTLSSILGNYREDEDKVHSMQIYYMERGGNLSNLRMNFNLPQKDQLTVEKAFDNTGASEAEQAELEQQQFDFQVTEDGKPLAGNKRAYYTLLENGTIVAQNQPTDAEGKLKLKYGQKAVFTLENPRAETRTYKVTEVGMDGKGYMTAWETAKNTQENIQQGGGTEGGEVTIPEKQEYDRTNVDVYSYTFHNVKKGDIADDEVVADYGKAIEVDVTANDKLYGTGSEATVVLDNADTSEGTFSVSGNKIIFTPSKFMTKIEQASYHLEYKDGEKSDTANVSVIPATNVYYEAETAAIATSGDVTVENSTSGSEGSIQDDGTIGKGGNYGYDSHYNADQALSGGKALVVQAGASASFEFTGTGVELFVKQNGTTGSYKYVVTDAAGNIVNGTNNRGELFDNTWQAGGDLYQIPSSHTTGLPFGTYKVEITAGNAAGNSFILDSIRIYDPLGPNNAQANAAYATDLELSPSYSELRDMILTDGTGKTTLPNGQEVNSAFYVDSAADNIQDMQGFELYGPNNEVYLKKGGMVFTTIRTDDGKAPATIQLGTKAPKGTASAYVGLITGAYVDENGETQLAGYPFSFPVASATEQYLTSGRLEGLEGVDWKNGVTLAVAFDPTSEDSSDSILSITKLKYTGTNTVSNSVSAADTGNGSTMQGRIRAFAKGDTQELSTVDVAAIMAEQYAKHGTFALTNPADIGETKDQPAGASYIEPKVKVSVSSAKLSKKNVKRKAKVTMTVKTSASATSVVVKQGKKIVKTLKKSTKSSGKTKTWTYTFKAPAKKGTYKYNVTAKAGAKASKAKTLPLKVTR